MSGWKLPISFTIPGEAQGKGRARSTATGRHYTPAKTRNNEAFIKLCAMQAMGSDPPITGACRVKILVMVGIPKSTSKKKEQQMLNGFIFPTKKPDCDNILKSVLDACNGIVYVDDVQVIRVEVQKAYSSQPMTEVYIQGWSEVL
jgi:Holliday junction resolvase RusA-like endonuclease